MQRTVTKDLLDSLYARTFNVERFKQVDPCGIVYQLMEHTTIQLDIELGALFVAMISWGNRKAILPAALHMIRDEMHWHPAEFIRTGQFETAYADARNSCVYRTLNVDTFRAVCRNVRNAINGADTLEQLFANLPTEEVIRQLCEWLAPARMGTPGKSACKRICMYVRWMTRAEAPDLNIWKHRPQSDLYAVMDTHVMQLTCGLLTTRQASWKACTELTNIFRSWHPDDPLRYDVALMTLADLSDE